MLDIPLRYGLTKNAHHRPGAALLPYSSMWRSTLHVFSPMHTVCKKTIPSFLIVYQKVARKIRHYSGFAHMFPCGSRFINCGKPRGQAITNNPADRAQPQRQSKPDQQTGLKTTIWTARIPPRMIPTVK